MKLKLTSSTSLKKWREKRGVSLRKLGAEARIDFRRLSLVERGLTPDEIARLNKAADILGG
jgi:transcriptional regulator with XRE-family HTH domain